MKHALSFSLFWRFQSVLKQTAQRVWAESVCDVIGPKPQQNTVLPNFVVYSFTEFLPNRIVTQFYRILLYFTDRVFKLRTKSFKCLKIKIPKITQWGEVSRIFCTLGKERLQRAQLFQKSHTSARQQSGLDTSQRRALKHFCPNSLRHILRNFDAIQTKSKNINLELELELELLV